MPLPEVRTDVPSLITDTIRDRFYKNQFEQFMQNDYASYQQELNNLSGALADPSDPDMASKILKSYSAATSKMITNATRFKSNPYITQLAQAHFQHDMKQFDNITQLATASMEAQGEGSADAAKREADEALAGKRVAETEEIQERTRQLREKPEIAKNIFHNWDISNPTMAVGALNRNDSPEIVKARDREKLEIQRSIGEQLIRERARTKQVNPNTGMVWGSGGEDELTSVVATEVNPTQINEIWEMQKLKSDFVRQTGATSEQVESMFPQYNWPKQVDPNTIPKGNLTPELTGRLILGDTGFANVAGDQAVFKSVKDITDKLPNDINSLGPNVVTATFNAIYSENGGNPHTHEPFQNYSEYKSWLQRSLRGWVNERIGGIAVSDAELDNETRGSRQRARAFMDAVVEKYGPHVARELRIPKTPEAPGFFGRLVSPETRAGIAKTVGGFFGEEVVGAPITETQPGVIGPRQKAVSKPVAPLVNTAKVMIQSLDNVKQNKYFRVQQAFMGSSGFEDWEPIGPNKDGDLIIKNSKTGKMSLATWDGQIKPVAGLKKQPKKK